MCISPHCSLLPLRPPACGPPKQSAPGCRREEGHLPLGVAGSAVQQGRGHFVRCCRAGDGGLFPSVRRRCRGPRDSVGVGRLHLETCPVREQQWQMKTLSDWLWDDLESKLASRLRASHWRSPSDGTSTPSRWYDDLRGHWGHCTKLSLLLC